MEVAALTQLLILIAAALVTVSAAVRLGLGSIVGYLAAGVLVGPHGLGLVAESELLRVLAEFGVVFLLFALGLDLPLARLRAIAGRALALGIAQILLTSAGATGAAWLLGLAPAAALAVGMGLALSSTAVVLRSLSERRLLHSRIGRIGFAVLLLQDLAVAPMLLVVLAVGGRGTLGLDLLRTLFAGLLFVGAAWALGPRLLAGLYRRIHALRLDELKVALSLLVAVGFAWLAELAGLSLAFGGLMAGMLLADTAYRHQVAADIRPFRGLLVGLFFLTVGMTVEVVRPALDWALVVLVAAALYAAKGLFLAALARALGFGWRPALMLGLLLGQGGEFAFVLWSAASASGVLPQEVTDLLGPAVVVTMMLTPIAMRWVDAEPAAAAPVPSVGQAVSGDRDLSGHVILAGGDRVALQVAQALSGCGVPWVGLDGDVDRVARARRRGYPFFVGDVCQPDVLEAVRLENAAVVVVALEDPRRARQLTALVRYLFPELPVLVRVPDEEELEGFLRLGATQVVPEVVETGRHLAAALLRLLADRTEPPETHRAASR